MIDQTLKATVFQNQHRNRLISVTIITDIETMTVNYRYDYLNRLVSRTVDQYNAETLQTTQTVEHFIHDRNQIALQFKDNTLLQRNFWGKQ
ncbi:MAG: hypothetical protein LBT09_01780 [Planctomycetaceae bacterium]|jgi:hypothetical protein|nr:hypothetical protein [Planctomycetaceae bacterium]